MSVENENLAERTDRVYAAQSALAQAKSPRHRLGIAEMVGFLNDPARLLTSEEQRALFSDPRLRADYRRLKALATAFELPALAAASTGAVEARRFQGGTIDTHRSRVPGQIYVILRFDGTAAAPRMMLLESPDGDLVKRALPAAHQQGEIVMVMDERSDADAAFLRLLADSTSTGSFML